MPIRLPEPGEAFNWGNAQIQQLQEAMPRIVVRRRDQAEEFIEPQEENMIDYAKSRADSTIRNMEELVEETDRKQVLRRASIETCKLYRDNPTLRIQRTVDKRGGWQDLADGYILEPGNAIYRIRPEESLRPFEPHEIIQMIEKEITNKNNQNEYEITQVNFMRDGAINIEVSNGDAVDCQALLDEFIFKDTGLPCGVQDDSKCYT